MRAESEGVRADRMGQREAELPFVANAHSVSGVKLVDVSEAVHARVDVVLGVTGSAQ